MLKKILIFLSLLFIALTVYGIVKHNPYVIIPNLFIVLIYLLFVSRFVENSILRLITTLTLDATDGKQTIADSNGVFSSIDSDFKNWSANKTGISTKESLVDVYEMAKDARFTQMFGSLNSDLDKLCLTQHQILNFIQKHRNWLRTEGYGTLFLFKADDQFFVARVGFNGDGSLRVVVRRFEDDSMWNAVYRHRVVVPQLDA